MPKAWWPCQRHDDPAKSMVTIPMAWWSCQSLGDHATGIEGNCKKLKSLTKKRTKKEKNQSFHIFFQRLEPLYWYKTLVAWFMQKNWIYNTQQTLTVAQKASINCFKPSCQLINHQTLTHGSHSALFMKKGFVQSEFEPSTLLFKEQDFTTKPWAITHCQ